MENVLELTERRTLEVCELVMGYLMEHGRRSEAQPWLDKYDVFYVKTRKAQIERSQVTSDDELHQHHLDPEFVQMLSEQLFAVPGIREAYLVEKVVEHFPDSPVYVLMVLPNKGRFFGNGDPELMAHLSQSLQFPFDMLIYDMADSETKHIKKRVKRIESAQIV